MRTRGSILALAILVAACGQQSVLHPPQGPGTDFPCGYQGISCDVHSGDGCCDGGEYCGHDLQQDPTGTCPKGECCAGDPDGTPISIDAARKHHPQRPKLLLRGTP